MPSATADRRRSRHPLELALLDAVDGGLADAAGLAGERLLRPALQLARVLDDVADVLGVITCVYRNWVPVSNPISN